MTVMLRILCEIYALDGQDDPGKLKNRNCMPKKEKEKAKKDIIMKSRQ